MKIFRLVSLSLVMTSLWQGVVCRGGDPTIDDFRARYAAEGVPSERTFAEWRGTIELEESPQDLSQGGSKKTSTMEFAISGPLKKLVTHHPADARRKSPARDEVFILDKTQGYKLDKKAGSSDYVVAAILPKDKSIQQFEGGIGRLMGAPCSLIDRRISSILQKGTTRVDSVKAIDHLGRSMIQVGLRYGSSGQSQATIILDPSMGYLIRRSELQVGDLGNATITCVVDYKLDKSGQVVPSVVECNDLDGKVKRLTFRDVSCNAISPEEFSLKSYGLPDLTEPAPGDRRSFASWLVGGALVCFGGGVGLWLITRRSR